MIILFTRSMSMSRSRRHGEETAGKAKQRELSLIINAKPC